MDTRIDDNILLLLTTVEANRILAQMTGDLCGPPYLEVKLRIPRVEAVMLALVESGYLEVKVWTRKARE